MKEDLKNTTTKVCPKDLERFCIDVMLKAGIREDDARITADVLVTTDTWGVYTHGTRQLRGLLKNFRSGRLDVAACEEVLAEGSGWALVDAHHSMPPVASFHAMELAIRKAKISGISYVGVRHSSHFGAAGYYANLATNHDMIGLAFCNVDPEVIVPGSRGKVLGTNPLAYAVPAGKEKPVIFDIATSSVAASKVYFASIKGESIPDNWLVDSEGIPTKDSTAYLNGGSLQPMAGHKGYGLALFVEIISAVLTGAAVTKEVKSWVKDTSEKTNEGHAFIAIDIGAIMPIEHFKDRMDNLIQEIRSAPKATGVDRIYLPGEIELEKRDIALEDGMLLPDELIASLTGLAEDYDVSTKIIFRHVNS